MTVIAVVGDATTTLSVALAAGWPAAAEAIVLEADPSGGSLTGWLDTPPQPSLATIVANAGPDADNDHRSTTRTVEVVTQHSQSGVRFVANAVRGRAAHRAIEEAAGGVLAALAAGTTTVIADTGGHRAGHGPSPALCVASLVVVAHRQASASAAAATVRIERLVETFEELSHLDAEFVLAIVGDTPFDPAEIGAFIDDSVPDTVRMVASIANDPLAAATIAGRSGVSAKRLRRLPLMRDASRLAAALCDRIDAQQHEGPQVGPGAQQT